jgi:hypothetical protein
LRNHVRFRLGRKLMSGKELQAELLALRIPHGGNSSASMDCVNLGYRSPLNKAPAKRSAVREVVAKHRLTGGVPKCCRPPVGLAVAYPCEGLRMTSLGHYLNPKSAGPPTRAEPELLLAVVGKVSGSPFCSAAASSKAYEVGGSDRVDAPSPFQVTVANSKAA